MRSFKNILVTGGCGFIGTTFIKYLLNRNDFTGRVINLDKLTYAGNPHNLIDIEETLGGKKYFLIKEDICNTLAVQNIFDVYDIDCVIHFAAESHVDRSILGPKEFFKTNIEGTFNLLDIAKNKWINQNNTLFHHVSTDEVYGSLGSTGYFSETTPYDPRSPYSASKASSDHMVKAYYHTFKLPITVSNCSNNYGPYQFPEKLLPLMILNILDRKPLPVYGEGKNVRDWLYVEDHASAIWTIVTNGKIGETYNVGGENEWENIKLVNFLCEKMSAKIGAPLEEIKGLITFVKDRPGHDLRYAISCDKIKNELNWKPSRDFATGLDDTIDWYLNNHTWIQQIKSGEYQTWLQRQYSTN